MFKYMNCNLKKIALLSFVSNRETNMKRTVLLKELKF